MNVEDAREKFGSWGQGADGGLQWEIDRNKVRGAMLQYSRDVEYLEGPASWPDAEHWIDHWWTWMKKRVGVGYKGILQCREPSPSGRFDRLGKNEATRIANSYHENHDEFKVNMDEAWEQIDKEEEIPSAEEGYAEGLDAMEDGDVIQTFFNIYANHDELLVGKRQSPNVRAYKYHLKQWVFEVETIQSEEATPSAEALVGAWVNWLVDEILSLADPVVDVDPENGLERTPQPEVDDVVGWCRELWEDSGDFRSAVLAKWNKEVEGDGEETPDADDMVDIREGISTGQRKTSGQQKFSDMMGDNDGE